MKCENPIDRLCPTTKTPWKFPCGKCNTCRFKNSSGVQCRAVLEHASKGSKGHFISLTYDKEHTQEVFNKSHADNFLKRVKRNEKKNGNTNKITFQKIGETGDLTGRLHFHFLTFGTEHYPKSSLIYPETKSLHEQLWPYGFSYPGDITPGSIAYVSGYITNTESTYTQSSWSQNFGVAGFYAFLEEAYQQHLIHGNVLTQFLGRLTVGKNKYTFPRTFHKKYDEWLIQKGFNPPHKSPFDMETKRKQFIIEDNEFILEERHKTLKLQQKLRDKQRENQDINKWLKQKI